MATDLDQLVDEFRHRPLGAAGPFTFVAADALTMKVREGGRVVNAAVLVAVGVNGEGHREVLGMRVGDLRDRGSEERVLRRLGRRGSGPSTRAAPMVQAEAAVLAESPRGCVLSLPAHGLDELADVVEPREAAAVDSLVHLAEASGLRRCSAGRGGETKRCKSGDRSCSENALHVTSLLLRGAGSPHRACVRHKESIGLVRIGSSPDQRIALPAHRQIR
jgi:hypothetical protein